VRKCLPLDRSTSLADLAGRIEVEHTAVTAALKDSVTHAIVAGELLIEAKAQLAHGQWLPWLRDHCTMSERTAQLYMRCAKNRGAIEDRIRNGVADLGLNEAATSTGTRLPAKQRRDIADADAGNNWGKLPRLPDGRVDRRLDRFMRAIGCIEVFGEAEVAFPANLSPEIAASALKLVNTAAKGLRGLKSRLRAVIGKRCDR
jgi:hypothetical protein